MNTALGKEINELVEKTLPDWDEDAIINIFTELDLMRACYNSTSPFIRYIIKAYENGDITKDGLVYIIFNGLSSNYMASERKSNYEHGRGYYQYIPACQKDFIQNISAIYKKYPNIKSFIDVGCGLGDKSFLASLLGIEKSYGIEYNHHTYEIGQYFLRKFKADLTVYKRSTSIIFPHIFQGDAFRHDFSTYDLIYLYVPIYKEKNMHKLYEHISSTMHVGAILFDISQNSLMDWYKRYKNKYAPIHDDYKYKNYVQFLIKTEDRLKYRRIEY